jgi:internalin A
MSPRNQFQKKLEKDVKSFAKRNQQSKGESILDDTLELIDHCKQSQEHWLDLSNRKLREIPEEVFSLNHLSYLDLSDNLIEEIPERLWGLPALARVYLQGNPLRTIPNGHGISIDINTYIRLHKDASIPKIDLIIDHGISKEETDVLLKLLNDKEEVPGLVIGDRNITIGGSRRAPTYQLNRILNEIGSLKSLRSLSIRGILLKAVPDGIRKLHRLDNLGLNALGLQTLPEWLGDLPLVALFAVDNNFKDIHKSFPKFTRLQHLDLSWNKLDRVPEQVFELTSLTELGLYDCNLREIPPDLLHLTKLKKINLGSNPFESPPQEICSKGLDAIKNYWRQGLTTGIDYLCEAKLIILGEPGAGKTSLAKKLQNGDYKLTSSEKSTEGIAVIRFQFTTAIKVEGQESGNSVLRDFQVNIWDFGGQEIYHATHQFFLTRRSVYILVCDDRKEDTDFSYWLNIVEMLSDASPLIIVKNEKQDRSRDINLSSLRARFHNLRASVATNLDTNRGLSEIVDVVQRELAQLPHVGTGLPATWNRVREALEQEQRDYIGIDEYLDICQKNGFLNFEDKMQLSGYLHDLGICLHFQDDPVLRNKVILKPAWGTDAVYRVLDDSVVIAQHGRFSKHDLKRLWAEKKYQGMQSELLQLMIKFQLCYAIENDNIFIAPQLLTSEHPHYSWDILNNLAIRYEYKFLPKGIITRLIVALHHLISNGLVWKTGVVFEREGSFAEVIEDYSQRWIKVRVRGANRLGLLAIVDDQLDRLHASFNRLQYDRYVPCPCDECRFKDEPYCFTQESLIKMAKKETLIQCHESGEFVNAEQLLRDVFPAALAPVNMMDQSEKHLIIAGSNTTPTSAPEVYVSYSWVADSMTIVDKLEKTLNEHGIRILRDRNEITYTDSIQEFMNRLGQGFVIIVVITDEYLKSQNCMFELLAIAKAKNFRKRVFPIVMPSAKIYKPLDRIQYIKYWDEEAKKLDQELKSLSGENLAGLQAELTLYSEIRRLFDQITETLRDMNSLTMHMHIEKNFEQLISKVTAELEKRNVTYTLA